LHSKNNAASNVHKSNRYTAPHQDPIGVGSLLFGASGVATAGEKTFMGKSGARVSILPITHEKMLVHGLHSKLKAAQYLKAGGNVLGGAGYLVSASDYGVQIASGNYREARKASVDMFMGAIMFAWPVGTAVGLVGLYVNNDYHSDRNNP